MASRWDKWEAKLVLASQFFLHLFKRVFLFWRKRPGLEKFLENYYNDGIVGVSEQERDAMPSYQKCLTCSFCTFTCEAIQKGRAPSAFEPKFLMLGAGRSAHESEFVFEVPCLECQRCTIECPNDVPVHAMAQQIIDRRNRRGFRS